MMLKLVGQRPTVRRFSSIVKTQRLDRCLGAKEGCGVQGLIGTILFFSNFRALTIANLPREQAGRARSQLALREIVDDGSIGRESTGRLLERFRRTPRNNPRPGRILDRILG
jgi:hypothetical protein